MTKPLGVKAYGSIGHVVGSRLGPGDHSIGESSSSILLAPRRNGRRDRIVVTEKLDGSCVSVAKKDGEILALQRTGWLAQTSPYEHLQKFAAWVRQNPHHFEELPEGCRIVGEWLALAHGTIYEDVGDPPFYVFDLFYSDNSRASWEATALACSELFHLPTVPVLYEGDGGISAEEAMALAGERGALGAVEGPEGVVYRCETRGKFNFMGKYVREDHVPGKYLALEGNGVSELTWLWPS